MEPITGSDKIPKQRWKLVCLHLGAVVRHYDRVRRSAPYAASVREHAFNAPRHHVSSPFIPPARGKRSYSCR